MIVRKNGGETAIKELQVVSGKRQPNGIYRLDGRYVGTDFKVLQPGIYIVNGRKVVR